MLNSRESISEMLASLFQALAESRAYLSEGLADRARDADAGRTAGSYGLLQARNPVRVRVGPGCPLHLSAEDLGLAQHLIENHAERGTCGQRGNQAGANRAHSAASENLREDPGLSGTSGQAASSGGLAYTQLSSGHPAASGLTSGFLSAGYLAASSLACRFLSAGYLAA